MSCIDAPLQFSLKLQTTNHVPLYVCTWHHGDTCVAATRQRKLRSNQFRSRRKALQLLTCESEPDFDGYLRTESLSLGSMPNEYRVRSRISSSVELCQLVVLSRGSVGWGHTSDTVRQTLKLEPLKLIE
jgi:hypothetical protein